MPEFITLRGTNIQVNITDGKVEDFKTGLKIAINKDSFRKFRNAYRMLRFAYEIGTFKMTKAERKKMVASFLKSVPKDDAMEGVDLLLKSEEELLAELKKSEQAIIREVKRKLSDARKELEKQKRLNKLLTDCIVYTDRKGKTIDEGSNPFSSWIEKIFEGDSLKIAFWVQTSPYSNGSCDIKVWYKKNLVLDASGNYLVIPFNCAIKVYAAGEWENIIREFVEQKTRH